MRYLAGVGDVSIPTRALFSVMLQLGVWTAGFFARRYAVRIEARR